MTERLKSIIGTIGPRGINEDGKCSRRWKSVCVETAVRAICISARRNVWGSKGRDWGIVWTAIDQTEGFLGTNYDDKDQEKSGKMGGNLQAYCWEDWAAIAVVKDVVEETKQVNASGD